MQNFYSHCRKSFDDDDLFLRDIASNKNFKYADLHRESGIIANKLKKLGLQKGDRLLLQLDKSPWGLFWYFACLRSGVIFLPLNTAYQEQEVEYFLDDAEPKLVICNPKQESLYRSLCAKTKLDCIILCLDENGSIQDSVMEGSTITPTIISNSNNGLADFKDYECKSDDTAVILYTSGTTGKPKGAMITHGNLVSNANTLSHAWHWQRDDVLLHSLPIFHIHGLFVAIHLAVLNSSTILFLEKFDPEKVLKLLPQATVYMGVPTHYVRILKNDKFEQSICKNMRLFTSGSAPLLPQTFIEFEKRAGQSIVERYGMTETGMNTTNPYNGERRPGTVGLLLEGVEGKILDDEGSEADIGTPGTLYVKGNNIFKGYWRMPKITQQEFNEDGFFRTGDITVKDEAGYISIIGRNKDMIITGGLNVYPKEIESLIDKMHGVLESAIIGVADEDFGESVTAIIVKENHESTISKEDIIDSLKNLVANFKVPKRVHFVDELPRNTMGKVQKVVLRKMFA
ncbi:MAG: malonyl-CoA/methylmalonyl-CoA synthetase [Candidatus Azotimanducaceae bacterium]|jgi:malonyl-CoA/methylmalonyl-CoA synthetase